MKAASFKHQPLFVLALCCLCVVNIQAQQKTIPLCDEERAVLLAEKQVEEISMLDQPQKQIAVMIRAADVLWKAQQSTARKIFSEAFALAEKVFKEKRNEIKLESGLLIIPDQRFIVMQAIAKHDAVWVKHLADRIVEEAKKQSEQKMGETTRHPSDVTLDRMQNEILNFALSAVAHDPTTAVSMIRSAFSNRLSINFPSALYALAEVNQAMADQIYMEALKIYANAPIDEFLYLSSYPFRKNSNIGLDIHLISYSVPPSILPNSLLQRLFIETILRRAEMSLRTPEQPKNDTVEMSESAYLFVAFNQLETLALQYQSSYINRIVEMKAYLKASLKDEARELVDILSSANVETPLELRIKAGMISGKAFFTKYAENAERETNPVVREWMRGTAILNHSDDVSIEDMVDLTRKIDDEKLRSQLLNVIYFKGTKRAIKDGQFSEASQLAKNIEQLDFRAYLAYEMAAAALKKEKDKLRAKEILEDVLELAYKSPNTSEKARTLLGVVQLYVKLDKIRTFEVMAEAVKTLNTLSEPNISTTSIYRKIEGKRFLASYDYQVEGFSLEAVFRLLAPMDFDGALWRATGLEDKSLRGLAVLSLVASCLEENERMKKQEAEKYNKAKESAGRPDAKEAKKLQDKKPLQR